MNQINTDLIFEFDVDDLVGLQHFLGATHKEMLAAHNRAIARTSVTMKKLSNVLLRDEMDAKSLKVIRKRMQVHKYSFRLGQTSSDKLDELKLWFGLNDMRTGHLKGRTSRIGTKRQPKGARFTSKKLGSTDFDQGFVANRYNRRSIFMRKSAARFPLVEAQVPVAEKMGYRLQDEVLMDLPDVFMKHFETDMKGRVAARDTIKSRQHGWNKFK